MLEPDRPGESQAGMRYALRALRHRNFRLYFSGQVISQTGAWMQIVAQGWLIYRLTDSPLMLGLVNFVALVPVVPISLLAGVLSDRLPRRNLILFTEVVLMLQAVITALLIWTGQIQVWHIILLSFILGAAAALEQPARLAFIYDVVGKEDLSNAVALNSSAYNTARIVGPAIAGVLVAWIGEAGCFLINGVTYLAVIGALLLMRLAPQEKPEGQLRVGQSLVQGLRYTWDTQTIRHLLFIVAVASFLTIPYTALMPVFARDVLKTGPEGLGFLMTGVGIGAIGGALLVAGLKTQRQGVWLALGNIAGPAFLVLFCFSKNFLLSLVLVILIGASNALRQTLANSLIQLTAAREFHGRVMSIFNLLFNGMSRLGALGIGSAAEVIGAPLALGAGAGLCVMIGILTFWRMPKLRAL